MKKVLFFALILAAGNSVLAQKIKIVEGNLSPLKGQKSIAVEFSYEDMTVGSRDAKSEEVYIADRKKELNQKEAGRGDKWAEAWVSDRKDRFEPQFRELYSKHANMTTAGDNPTYTMIFRTTRTEPGWNVGVMRVPAFIDAEVTIVETANRDKVIAKLTVKNSPGRDAWGFDFDTGTRLQEAYAKAGKEVGQVVAKNAK
jgi:hypothetical protein